MNGMIWGNVVVALAFIGLASWLCLRSQAPDNSFISSSKLTSATIKNMNDPDDLKQLIFSLKQAAKSNAEAGKYIEKKTLELASILAFAVFLVAIGNILGFWKLRKRSEHSNQ